MGLQLLSETATIREPFARFSRLPRSVTCRTPTTEDPMTEWAPPNVLGFDIRDGASRVNA